MNLSKLKIDEIYNLDWKHIVFDAIHSRPTSWGGINPSLVEYRNAGDCLAGAVIDEMKKKNMIVLKENIRGMKNER